MHFSITKTVFTCACPALLLFLAPLLTDHSTGVTTSPRETAKTTVRVTLAAPQPSAFSNTLDNNQRTLKSLNEQVVDLNFNETPFAEVMKTLTAETNLQFLLDHSAIDDSLTHDEPIRFQMSNLRLKTALRFMLRRHNATYLVDDGVVRILSMDVAADPEYFRRHSFDCRKLMGLVQAYEKQFPSGSSSFGSGMYMQGGFGGGGKAGGVFNQAPAAVVQQGVKGGGGFGGSAQASGSQAGGGGLAVKPKPEPPRASQLLIDLIKTLVTPDDWDDTNGDGSIIAIGGILMVSSSEETLSQIADLLVDLEQKYGPMPATELESEAGASQAGQTSGVTSPAKRDLPTAEVASPTTDSGQGTTVDIEK